MLVDTNLLIYATFEDAPEHRRVRAWLEDRFRDDVELAALAIEHGLVLASHDSGFRRFDGLRTVDPLA